MSRQKPADDAVTARPGAERRPSPTTHPEGGETRPRGPAPHRLQRALNWNEIESAARGYEIDGECTSVYVAFDGALSKIGMSGEVHKRMKCMVSDNPRASLVAEFPMGSRDLACKVEARAHRILANLCFSGEWFSCGPSEAIGAVRQSLREHGFSR